MESEESFIFTSSYFSKENKQSSLNLTSPNLPLNKQVCLPLANYEVSISMSRALYPHCSEIFMRKKYEHIFWLGKSFQGFQIILHNTKHCYLFYNIHWGKFMDIKTCTRQMCAWPMSICRKITHLSVVNCEISYLHQRWHLLCWLSNPQKDGNGSTVDQKSQSAHWQFLLAASCTFFKNEK